MNSTIIILFAAILIVAGLLFAVLTLTRKGGRQLDVEKYRVKWLTIEQQLVRDQPGTYQLAVLAADKLLDQALRERGYAGETMGERLKRASSSLSNRNAAWSAHKLRNQIAHESDIQVSYEAARTALAGFKRALKDVGAI